MTNPCGNPALVAQPWLRMTACLTAMSILVGSLVAQEVATSDAEVSHQATVQPDEVTRAASNTPVPLNARIDLAVSTEVELLTASKAEDGQLLRRLSLDLRGVVPTREELDAFVADKSMDRWAAWVARFLSDPLCDEHLVTFLDRMLMLRRPHSQVDRAAWLNYLREQVANNTPLDILSKQLLYSPWWNRDHRAAQRFFLDRDGDPHLIARDIGRVFLGRDMQCAQCHDHPLVDDYKQSDYHGLLAYVSTSSLAEITYKDAEGKDQKIKLYIERAAGDAPFESVFDKGVPFRSGPRMPNQTEQFEEYTMPDARYATEAPTGALPGVALPPKNSRRQLLADQLTARTNHAFVANWANRLWSLVFGKGLVQPLDMHHPDNPPSYPELLDLITDGLLEVDMQPRSFLEKLVLTEAYRRGDAARLQTESPSKLPDSVDKEGAKSLRGVASAKFAEHTSQRETLANIERITLAEYEVALDDWRKVQAERAAIRKELDAAEAAMLDAKKKVTETATVLATAWKRQTDTQARILLLDESAVKLQQAAGLAGGDDAELKQAIAVAKQRAEAARTQVPEINKAVIDTNAAAEAAVRVLAQATVKVQEIVATLQPVHQSLKAEDSTMILARGKWAAAKSALSSADRRILRFQHTLAWLDSLDSAKSASLEQWEAVGDDAAQQFATTRLQPLTAEQFCWSTLRVTGQLDAHIQVEVAELEKQSPLAADADEAARGQRRKQAMRGAFDKLRGNADTFVSLYASGPDKTDDDFFASADQALFTANAGSVFAWAGPGNNNVTLQAIALTDNAQIAQLLYWSLLCRQPSVDELKLVSEQIVASGEQRSAVIQEMVWGLLASAEFRFVR